MNDKSVSGSVPALVLKLKDVTCCRLDKQILRGASFTVRAGEHWALLGPNGAGRSTVMSFCGAVMFPTSATVCRWAARAVTVRA